MVTIKACCAMMNEDKCTWAQKHEFDMHWATSCGHDLWLYYDESADLVTAGMCYCCFCGRLLVAVEPTLPEDDDEERRIEEMICMTAAIHTLEE